MLFNTCTTNRSTERLMHDKVILSAQYKDGKFTSGKEVLTMGPKDFVSSTWRFFFEKNDQMPVSRLPVTPVDLSLFNSKQTGQLNSTWLGHSSLMINISGYKVLTDPVFETKVSILGPTRYNGDVPMDPGMLPDIDIVIISHDHYDHLNKASVLLLAPKTTLFVVPLAVGDRLVRWGVPQEKIIELDWWESYTFDSKLTISALPSQHFSGRGIFDRNTTLWASWAIKTPGFNLFFSGDSGYFDGFKEIGDRFGPFDMTFLECGAYDRMWKAVHMFPEETVQAHMDLKGKVLHPIHWGTFKLAPHPWYDPMQRVKKAAFQNGIQLATPIAGQTIEFGSGHLGTDWWFSDSKE